MRLSSLNPVSLLLGPIFQKEIRAAGRRRGTYAFRALYAAALLALVVVAFQGVRSETHRFGGVSRLQAIQTLAPAMAFVVVWFQFIALALAAPMISGPAICDEKRARTLATLLTTPLTAGQIVWGKLSSRFVQLGILALLAAPLLLAIRVFGGLDARFIVAATAISLSTALLGSALSIMYSTWHRRATGASFFGLLTLVLVVGGPTVIEGILLYALNNTGGRPVYPFHQQVLATCAPATLGQLTLSTSEGIDPPHVIFVSSLFRSGVIDLGPAWAVNSAYNLLATFAAALVSTFALRRVMRREGVSEGASAAATTLSRRKRRRRAAPVPQPATDPSTTPPPEVAPDPAATEAQPPLARDRSSREVSDRPVLWREVRQVTFGTHRRFLWTLVLAVCGLAVLYVRWGIGEEAVNGALAFLGAVAIMVQSVFMTTGSIAGEREARTWEVLLTTTLSGRDIVLGKALGALRGQWFFPAIILGHFLLATAIGAVRPIFLLHIVLIFLGPMLLFTSSGQFFSLFFRKGVTAAAWNLALALVLWVGSWVALGLVSWYADLSSGPWFDLAGRVCFAANPVMLTMSAVEPAVRLSRYARAPGAYHLDFSDQTQISSTAFTLVVLATFACFAAIAAGILFFTVRRFTRLSGRSS